MAIKKVKLPNNTTVDINDARNVVIGDGADNIVTLTNAEYQALATKDPNTVYIVTDVDPVVAYLGTNQIGGGGGAIPVETTIPVGGMLPNVFYSLGTISVTTTMTMAPASDNTKYNEWMFQFSTGDAAPVITWDAAIEEWVGGIMPDIKANKMYRIIVVEGGAVVYELSTPPEIPNYFYVQNETNTPGVINFASNSGPNINIEYSTDLENWTTETSISASTNITLPANGKVYMRGTNSGLATGYTKFRYLTCNVSHSVGGNILFLLDAITGNPTSAIGSALASFFQNGSSTNTTLVSAANLILPYFTCTEEHYRRLFRNCTALVYGPVITAETMGSRFCQELCDGCTSLIQLTCLSTNHNANYCTTNWLNNVSATGTFYKAETASWGSGASAVPYGWSIIDY